MKKLTTEPNQMRCDYLKATLESRGIQCCIRNELSAGSAAAGITGPLNFALPEIWVLDDAQLDDAQDILQELNNVGAAEETETQPSPGALSSEVNDDLTGGAQE